MHIGLSSLQTDAKDILRALGFFFSSILVLLHLLDFYKRLDVNKSV